MKKNYIYPATEVCAMNSLSVLMTSGENAVSSNISVFSEDRPGNAADAF